MEARRIQTFDDSLKFSNSRLESNQSRKGLSPVRKLKMDLKEDHLEIKIRIEGLWGKNYKIEVVEDCLILTALRYVIDEKSKGKFKWITSSFFLPYKVEEAIVESQLKAGELWISIPKRRKPNYLQRT